MFSLGAHVSLPQRPGPWPPPLPYAVLRSPAGAGGGRAEGQLSWAWPRPPTISTRQGLKCVCVSLYHTHTQAHTARPFLGPRGSCPFPGQPSTQAEAQTQLGSNALSSLEGLVSSSATLSSGSGGDRTPVQALLGLGGRGRPGRGLSSGRAPLSLPLSLCLCLSLIHTHTNTHTRSHGRPPHPWAPENHLSWVPTALDQAASLNLLHGPGRPCGGQGPCKRPPGHPGPEGRMVPGSRRGTAGPAVEGAPGGREEEPVALVRGLPCPALLPIPPSLTQALGSFWRKTDLRSGGGPGKEC